MPVENTWTEAILVSMLSPTNLKGARMKAYSELGDVIVPYDYSLSNTENYDAAAAALISKFNLPGRWIGGGLRENYVYVQVSP